MSEPISDERLSAALRSLPRERAGTGFTREVLVRLDRRPRRRAPTRWRLAAAAAAVAVLALSFGLREWRHAEEQRATVARLERLLAEKQALETELAALRRLTDEARPLVYVGGNERVDLVVDLARFQRQGGFGLPAAGRGAADLRPGEPPPVSRAVY